MLIALAAVGAVLWASVCVLAGAALGDAWLGALDRVGGKGLAVLGALLLLATALGVRIWRRARYGPAGAVTP